MQIDLDQLAQLAKTFNNPDPAYTQLAEAWRRAQARTPAERRADLERWLAFSAQVEIGGGQYAEAAGKLRRSLAAKLFTSTIAADTPFA